MTNYQHTECWETGGTNGGGRQVTNDGKDSVKERLLQTHYIRSWSLWVFRAFRIIPGIIEIQTRNSTMCRLCRLPIGVRAGGARGAAAPPFKFGQLRFFGQQEKIWAKPFFKDVSVFFISLKTQIFSILIWKNPEVSVIIQFRFWKSKSGFPN